jgi:hypothetical protein
MVNVLEVSDKVGNAPDARAAAEHRRPSTAKASLVKWFCTRDLNNRRTVLSFHSLLLSESSLADDKQGSQRPGESVAARAEGKPWGIDLAEAVPERRAVAGPFAERRFVAAVVLLGSRWPGPGSRGWARWDGKEAACPARQAPAAQGPGARSWEVLVRWALALILENLSTIKYTMTGAE